MMVNPICVFGDKSKRNILRMTSIFFLLLILLSKFCLTSIEKNDRGIKFRDYERYGVQKYCLTSPQKQEIKKYILKNSCYELAQKQTNGQITSEVIEDLILEFAQIF